MKKKIFKGLMLLSLFLITARLKNTSKIHPEEKNNINQEKVMIEAEPHAYGGWYCPDNLNGFPAVNIANWNKVPVVKGRMPTKEETRNGNSLIFIDQDKYPNAKPLNMVLPKLARIYNQSSKRDDLIVIIQAIEIEQDSIVGYRFLNGGNGSARFNEINFLSDKKIKEIPKTQFVSLDYSINATKEKIWDVLTNPKNARKFQQIFDKNNTLLLNWRDATNVNFHYINSGKLTSSFGDEMYGAFYIQNNYKNLQFTEKFFLYYDEKTKKTNFKITCGPYGDDFEYQKKVLKKWAKEVINRSEN